MNLDLKFYAALLLRRLPVMIVLFVCCLALGLGVAYTLPPRYVADAQLLVQSAQIEGSIVNTEATERLQVTRQQVLTRATLIDIAKKYDVFADEGQLSPDEVVVEMRLRSRIDIRAANRRDGGATFLYISFTDNDARTAANVVNELVTLFLAEDASARRNQAGQTLDFYKDEVDRLSLELSRKSGEIVTYEEANKLSLPSGNGFRLERQSQLQEMLNMVGRNRAALDAQRSNLLAMGSPGSGGVRQTREMAQLQEAEAQLADALSRFSDTNPRVRILRTQVERLREAAEASVQVPETEEVTASTDPNAVAIRLQIGSIDTQIAFLDEDAERAREELAKLTEAIDKTPETSIRLAELNRDYENLQRQYGAAINALNSAQAGEKIELASKGERLRVIEQAVAPEQPNAPNRKKIAAAGAAAGFALAAGFFVLAELLNRVVRRPADIVNGLGIQPFATIPYLETVKSKNRRRALWTILIVSLGLGIPVALWAVHEYYLPLDYIFDRITSRLGL